MSSISTKIEEFIENGFVRIDHALPRDFVEEWWAPRRLWLDENESDVPWSRFGSHLHFPRRRSFAVADVAPGVATMIRMLLGKDLLPHEELRWGDGFVVARPQERDLPMKPPWHKDGFFRHYLDSPEIGLVALVLWTDVEMASGPTALALNSVGVVAAALRDHPEGLDPEAFERLLPLGWPEQAATGEAGDVYLMHPFLLHARRINLATTWRSITNPAIPSRHPLRLGDGTREPAPVERAILQQVGCLNKDYLSLPGSRQTSAITSPTAISECRAWLNRQISLWEQRYAGSLDNCR